MASVEPQDLVDRFDEFYHEYYEDEIAELAQRYPSERRSLFIDWMELYRFDEDLADDFRSSPHELRGYAEEALQLFDLPIDLELGNAHVRVFNLGETTPIRDIRAEHVNRLISVRGIVRKATGVKPRIELAEFECQRCGTITRIPQDGGTFQEPHQCQGCERKGPFKINHEGSDFVDAQKLRVQESPEGLRGGQTPESIDIDIEDDITGEVSPGDSVRATGILRLDQQTAGNEETTLFDFHLEGVSIETEDEQFDEMDITEEDEEQIIRLADEPDIYQRMVDSIAPSIYGYENAKMAMALQLFSGVTKRLPDGSRTRGDLHMLLIGDPGTGKCIRGLTRILLSDGSQREIREIVEENLTNPIEIDDGYYQNTDIQILSVDGSRVQTRKATKVWKREAPDHLYRIRMESGREIEVTPSHPLFTQENSSILPTIADDLDADDFIAVPNVIEAEYCDSIDVSIDHTPNINANSFYSPDELTPEISRYLGYIIAEGHVQEHNNSVVVTNSDDEIIEDLSQILQELGLRHRVQEHHTRSSSKILRTSSADLVRFLRAVEPAILETSHHQRIPSLIQRAGPHNAREFLKAYIEGECTVSAKQREISVSSMSRELLDGVRTLLLRFGIDSQLHSKQPHDSFRLRISGKDFDRYVEEIGFITDRKAEAAAAYDGTAGNPNRDVIPNVAEALERIRTRLELSQFDCGVPRTTYQHYERGDRNPSRESLRKVVAAFEDRLNELQRFADMLETDRWEAVKPVRTELNVSQADIARRTTVTQTAISYHERNAAIPDGGVEHEAIGILAGKIHEALAAAPDIEALRQLVESDIGWDRIVEIEQVEPEEEWVYDLEVEGTHNYIANGVVSHNSQLLQYIRNIAPRSVYTSGKGSSAAGLTAAAVRDEFAEGNQWTLEAGALVLADRGIAAIDELDKMRCVTSDTVVRLGSGDRERIGELATAAAETGDIESLPNGRTIRDVGLEAWTMADDGGLVTRPVTAIHEYDAPDQLIEVVLDTGDRLQTTPDHPFIVRTDEGRTERPAQELTGAEQVYIPSDRLAQLTDGGAHADTDELTISGPTLPPEQPASPDDVSWCGIRSMGLVDATEDSSVYDLTVEGTHNYVANGLIVHNSEDRSALHEGLEAQEISISKAGINATLKARCSLLGAANPEYGRFDPYEQIGEQIALEPALISRFDLIFTITDKPDEEEDRNLAGHILDANYAGELQTRKDQLAAPEVSDDEIAAVTRTVTPAIEPELFRKYVAFAQQCCYPRMTDEARRKIEEFYVDLRSKGTDEDAPVPVTARKLEALVRLSEASARVRLSDTVEPEDADRVIEIVRKCLQDIGVDPETGQFDADVVETGRSKTQRERVKNLKGILRELQEEYDEGVPIDEVLTAAENAGIERDKTEHQIQKLKDQGEVFMPDNDRLRLV